LKENVREVVCIIIELKNYLFIFKIWKQKYIKI